MSPGPNRTPDHTALRIPAPRPFSEQSQPPREPDCQGFAFSLPKAGTRTLGASSPRPWLEAFKGPQHMWHQGDSVPQVCLPWLPADPAQRFFVDLKHPEGLQLIERTGLGVGEESEEAGGGESPEKKQQHLGRGEQPFRQRE